MIVTISRLDSEAALGAPVAFPEALAVPGSSQ